MFRRTLKTLTFLAVVVTSDSADTVETFSLFVEPLNVQVPATEYSKREQMPSSSKEVLKYLGSFEVTAYTAGPESTGKRPGDSGYGITRSGAVVKEGVTVAADWDVLPEGSRIYIEGVGERVVQDTGGLIRGKKLDVYISDLDTALEFGRQELKVYRLLDDFRTSNTF